MEAENKPTQDLKIDPVPIVRKPLRARKTMTLSSRKQMEILKNLHRLGKAGSSTFSVDNYLQLKMIGTDFLGDSSCKETNAGLELKPVSGQEPVAKLVVNSEISIYNDSPDVSRDVPCNGCNASAEVKRILDSGCFGDLLCTVYKKESGSPVSKPAEASLHSEPTTPTLDHPEERMSTVASFAGDTPTLCETVKTEETPENPTTPVFEEPNSGQSQEGNSPPGDAERKKRPSECEEVSSKHPKLSDETGEAAGTPSDKSPGLEKVRCLIHSHIENAMGALDLKVQQLNKRINHARKHKEITIRMIKKISRLDRHVNFIADFQKAQLSQKADLPGANGKITILNAARDVPSSPDSPSVPLKRRSVEAGEVPSKIARSSAMDTCLDVETASVQAGNASDVQQKRASSNAQTSVKASSVLQNAFLIDLTDEGDPNPDGKEAAVSVKANPPPESTKSQPPQPTTEPSKKIPALFSHLPRLPKTHLNPQQANGFRDSLPPQKLELAVAQVQNPKGIALRWNISQVDPRCAPIESFHLFICVENADEGTLSAWIKTNEIKALPLPMACSLSQFATSGKCYFAMQSKDVYGRFGPFCDIQSISAV